MTDFDIPIQIEKPRKKVSHVGVYGIAGRDIRLNYQEKVFLGPLVDRSKSKGFCWATNATLADVMKKSPRTIRNYLSKLESLGYIGRRYPRQP